MTPITIVDEPTRTIVTTALWRMILDNENLGNENILGSFFSLWDVLSAPEDQDAAEHELGLLLESVGFLRDTIRQVQATPLGQKVDVLPEELLAEQVKGIRAGIEENGEVWVNRDDADRILLTHRAAKRLLADQLAVEAVA
jgi:hypothetical protein